MRLTEIAESKKTKLSSRALREHYEIDIDFDSMSMQQASKMMRGVRGLLNESRKSHNSHRSPAHMKLTMMEQALTDRMNYLQQHGYRVVVENEEVQKSQVVLAAQDLIDRIQKMLEDVSKMNVEELNAVVQGIKNEFGGEQGEAFNQTVGEALRSLQDALNSSRDSLTTALGTVTGEISGAPAGGMGGDMMGGDMGDMPPGGDMGGDMAEPEMPEEPEIEMPEVPGNIGRGRR
jgi:hypothetical protein